METKRFKRIASCEHKKQYLTYEHAAFDAKAMRRNYDGKVHVYHCKYCNAWHVGGGDT